uniref:Bifunctional riboflavin kinase/FMN adenylyltransferase n=1 Tax=Paulinella micropora TaxID=1928728 RepID=A0A385HZD8_9EUKA|nr:putative riboflavin kinase/FAD synthase [Paulinella micropora]AXY63005.1 putative riboflavin kinase/FAD synthase [Paulinella micropora]
MIPLRSPQEARRPTAVAVGSFDGLHQGHRRVIAKIKSNTDIKSIPTVVSFWPHPREVLHGDSRLRLDMPAEKLTLLESLGIEQLVLVPFNKRLANLSSDQFVKEVLKQQLGAVKIAVGQNFRFGVNRTGNISDLGQIAQELGIKVEVLPMLCDGKEKISSSRIRKALTKGQIYEATRLLGRPYRFSGSITSIWSIERKACWDKIVLQVDGRKFLPCEGIYAVWVRLAQCITSQFSIGAMMSLRQHLSVKSASSYTIEVYLPQKRILSPGLELYIEPVHLIRKQQQFPSLTEMNQQITKDIESAYKILGITKTE